MKKYIPSVKSNNEFRDSMAARINEFAFKLRRNTFLSEAVVADICADLENAATDLGSSLTTGRENIESCFTETNDKLKALESEIAGGMDNRILKAAENLCFSVSYWQGVLAGRIEKRENIGEDEKTSYAVKKLKDKLDILRMLRSDFHQNEMRLEDEIQTLEKDIVELDEKLLDEENERMMNHLFRKISAAKSKVGLLNARRNNYSACFSIMDIIESNVSEIIIASKYSAEELGKAKAMLNIEKLKNVLSDPDKAIAVLKTIEADVMALNEKEKAIDRKLFSINGRGITEEVGAEAAKYKQELLSKKINKSFAASSVKELDKIMTNAEKLNKTISDFSEKTAEKPIDKMKLNLEE